MLLGDTLLHGVGPYIVGILVLSAAVIVLRAKDLPLFIEQLAIPALLVGGELDRCTPPAALEALAQVMPDAQTVLLPHIGHWPQLEDPEGFDAALLDFLAQRRVLH